MGYKILIADDEAEIRSLLKLYLENDGYSVVEAEDGIKALEMVTSEKPDLCVLDIMMPGMDGYQVLRKIREDNNVPVIILSAKDADSEKILGLNLGADDYIDKPFSVNVLGFKVKALMRRAYDMSEDRQLLTYDSITMDVTTRTVYKDDKEISITGKEFELLEYMMRHPEQVIRKEKLFDEVWGFDCFSEQGSLNVHIRWLREKLEDDPKNPTLIQTVWRVGYKFGGTKE